VRNFAGATCWAHLKLPMLRLNLRRDLAEPKSASSHLLCWRHAQDFENRIRPIKLPYEFLFAWRLADHHGAGGSALVEPRRDFVAPGRELRIIDVTPR
jgi:hypothetical protein